jgi:hypothetical protein
MQYRDDAVKLLQAVGEANEDPAFGLGENNECEMDIGGVPFGFFYVQEPEEALLINARIADGKHLNNRAEVLKALLERNHMWQGTYRGIVGLNPDDDAFYYSYKVPLPFSPEKDAPTDFLPLLITHMYGVIEVAQDIINPEQDDEEKPGAPVGMPQGMFDPTMMA